MLRRLTTVTPKLGFSLLAACCVAIGAASGFVLLGQAWPQDSNVTMHLSLGGEQTLIDGFSSFNQSAEDGLARWNSHLDRFQFSVVRASSLTPRDGDRRNSVFFSKTVFGDPFGRRTLAVTLRTFEGKTIVESDVIFNTAQPFNSYRGPLRQAEGGGTLHDFHRVAIHEFGHVLGLDHPDQANQNVAAIMNSLEGDIDSLQPDDIKGGQYLYGGPPPDSTPTPPPTAADNLINISTRGVVGTEENVLVGGFIVQGAQETSLVLRALGPSLAGSGIAGPLDDPVIEVRDASGTLVRRNDDWENDASAATVRANGLAPSDAREAALAANLGAGTFTAIVHGFNGSTGVGLVELYDLRATDARLANISTRALVQTGDRVMIAGFIIGGDKPKQVILRGIGPSLSNSGVAGPLPDPVLELHNGSGSVVAQNDDWRDGADAATIQSKGLAPAHDREAAVLATLAPGTYTAVLRGFENGTGVALAEAYDLSPPPNQ